MEFTVPPAVGAKSEHPLQIGMSCFSFFFFMMVILSFSVCVLKL